MIRPTSNTEFNSGNSQNNLHMVTRHFPREYSTVPHVLALPRGQDYNGSLALALSPPLSPAYAIGAQTLSP